MLFRSGSLVAIQGSIRVDSYQDQEGNNRKMTRVNANRVQFLDSKKDKQSNNVVPDGQFQDFQTVDDTDDIPF